MTWLDLITTIILVVTLGVVLLYMHSFHRSARWEESIVGRALMFKASVWAATIAMVILSYITDDNVFEKVVRIFVALAMLIAQLRMLYVMVKQQRKVHAETEAARIEGDNSDS